GARDERRRRADPACAGARTRDRRRPRGRGQLAVDLLRQPPGRAAGRRAGAAAPARVGGRSRRAPRPHRLRTAVARPGAVPVRDVRGRRERRGWLPPPPFPPPPARPAPPPPPPPPP